MSKIKRSLLAIEEIWCVRCEGWQRDGGVSIQGYYSSNTSGLCQECLFEMVDALTALSGCYTPNVPDWFKRQVRDGEPV